MNPIASSVRPPLDWPRLARLEVRTLLGWAGDGLILLGFAIMIRPGLSYAGPVPLYWLALASGFGCLIAELWLARRTVAGPRVFWLAALFGAWMAALGWLRPVSTWDWCYDVAVFGALILGIEWGFFRTAGQLHTRARLLALVATGLCLADTVALLQSAAPRGEFDLIYGFANGAGMLMIVVPFVLATSEADGPRERRLGIGLGWLAIGVLVLGAWAAGTRSVLLWAAALGAFAIRVRVALPGQAILIGALLLVLIGGIVMWQPQRVDRVLAGTLLYERIVSFEPDESPRLLEAGNLVDQLSARPHRWLVGMGFGSLTKMPEMARTDTGRAPHLGVLTYLQKGGLLTLGVLGLVPFLYALVQGLRPSSTPATLAGCGGVLGYFAIAFVSGGWFVFQLFLYGVALGVVSRGRAEGEL